MAVLLELCQTIHRPQAVFQASPPLSVIHQIRSCSAAAYRKRGRPRHSVIVIEVIGDSCLQLTRGDNAIEPELVFYLSSDEEGSARPDRGRPNR